MIELLIIATISYVFFLLYVSVSAFVDYFGEDSE